MTATQARAAAKGADALVVLCVGAIEQHGPHLPVGVDALLGEIFLSAALPLLPEEAPVYVAPSLLVGKSNEHEGFPGTLVLGRESLRQQLNAVAGQLADWGFQRLRVLNTHGGNASHLKTCLREIEETWGLETGFLQIPFPHELGDREAAFGIHAGAFETGVIAAACPEWVDLSLARCYWIDGGKAEGELRPEFAPATFAWKALDLTPCGTMGDATKGSAAQGEAWISAIGEALARQIKEFLP
jgi:creatinine amidohydrolase